MRAHNHVDLTGKRFHMLTAVSCVGVKDGKTRWLCLCDCGSETMKAYQHLVLGLTRSCGCLRRKTAAERLRALKTTHGLSDESWYSVWAGMMHRCYNSNGRRFNRYGGRGIDVCERWRKDPRAFHADMGDPPADHSLDRIDNDKGYSPENCRWATVIEQNNNRCSTMLIAFNGRSMSVAQWAREVGVSKATMYFRLRNWPVERALTTPKTN